MSFLSLPFIDVQHERGKESEFDLLEDCQTTRFCNESGRILFQFDNVSG
jgi:hypothetical protein